MKLKVIPIVGVTLTILLLALTTVIVAQTQYTKIFDSGDLRETVAIIAWSPDGSKLVAGTGNYRADSTIFYGHVYVYSASSWQLIWNSGNLNATVWSITFSPDSSKLAVGAWYHYDPSSGYHSRVHVYSTSDWSMIWDSGDLEGAVTWWDIAWSPDGSKLAVAINYFDPSSGIVQSRVYVYSTNSWSKIFDSGDLDGEAYSVTFSPDGSKLAVGTGWEQKVNYTYYYHGNVLVYSTSNWQLIWNSGDLGEMMLRVAFSPDGSKLAVGTGYKEGRAYVYSTSSWQLIWNSEELGFVVLEVAFSPDGSKLATAVQSSNGFLVYVYSTSDWSMIWNSGSLYELTSIAFSPDSSKLAIGARYYNSSSGIFQSYVYVYSTSNWQLIWNSGDLGEMALGVAFSPDSSKLAVAIHYYNSSSKTLHYHVYVYSSEQKVTTTQTSAVMTTTLSTTSTTTFSTATSTTSLTTTTSLPLTTTPMTPATILQNYALPIIIIVVIIVGVIVLLLRRK